MKKFFGILLFCVTVFWLVGLDELVVSFVSFFSIVGSV